MSDRLDALRSKLPAEVLSIIRGYDSHLLADAIREIKFEEFLRLPCGISLKQLTNCNVWLPLARELMRRVRHNRSVPSNGGVWLPCSFSTKVWIMSFERWQFETLDGLCYLQDWVIQEYLAKVRQNGSSGDVFFPREE